MKIGPALRRWMPPAFERFAAGVYRRVFVDLGKVAHHLAAHIPEQAHMLDIGGGDGELLNRLFALRPDIKVVMVDVADSVGKFIEPRFHDRVTFLPRMRIEDHILTNARHYDAALISDVLHHIPVGLRRDFLSSVRAALRDGGSIFIKDVQPGHFIATLSLYCDRHISGDRGVSLVSMREASELASTSGAGNLAAEIGLHEDDAPNYILRIDVA